MIGWLILITLLTISILIYFLIEMTIILLNHIYELIKILRDLIILFFTKIFNKQKHGSITGFGSISSVRGRSKNIIYSLSKR